MPLDRVSRFWTDQTTALKMSTSTLVYESALGWYAGGSPGFGGFPAVESERSCGA